MGDGKLTWLHLSDFHFGNSTDWQRDVVLQGLERDVIGKLAGLGLQPDLVFITGDIADRGKAAEYDIAQTRFQSMAEMLGHDPRLQWFLVPGNHDVDRDSLDILSRGNRATLNEDTIRDALSKKEIWSRFSTRQTHFFKFTHDFLGQEQAWRPETPWQVAHREIAGIRLAVLCLNSAWASQEREEKGKLLLGEFQLRKALAEAEKNNPHLKIALFHHPLEDLADFDRRICDGIFTREDGCHLLLRGHLHDVGMNFRLNPGGGYLELAAGACWQGAKHPHGAMVVQLDPADRTGTVHCWTWDPDKGGFWKRDNPYPNMDNGRYPFDFPADWRLPGDKTDAAATGPGAGDTPAAAPPSPWVPAAYGLFLERELRHLDAVVVAGEATHFALKSVYVPLFTDWRDAAERPKDSEKQPRREEDFRRPLADLAASPHGRHFLISGEPGSGKSTFINYTCLELLQNSPQTLVIRLELKELGAWLADRCGEKGVYLLRWAAETYQNQGLNEVGLAARSGRGRLLWLLDGLDEIFDEGRRLRAARVIGRWFGQEPGMADRLLITTRPHALQQRGIVKTLGLGTSCARVVPLQPEEQKTFLERWYRALYGENRHKADKLLAKLWADLEYNRELSDKRANPLMLATIATIYHQGKALPQRRADLYGMAVEVMLRQRFGPLVGGSKDRVDSLREGLAEVAWAMMERGVVRELGHGDFLDFLKRGCYPEREPDKGEMAALARKAELLGSQSGLLAVKDSPATYSFRHLGFQEYLAARYCAHQREPLDLLKAKLDLGAWREVVLLTAGCLFEAGARFRALDYLEALEAVCGKGAERCGRLSLVVAAAADAPPGRLPEALADKLREKAVALLKNHRRKDGVTERTALGLALGRLGDPRLGMDEDSRWRWLPPGRFAMGDQKTEAGFRASPVPEHQVTLSRGFYMAIFPVTNGEYQPFIKAGGYEKSLYWDEAGWGERQKEGWNEPAHWREPRFNIGNQPVVGLSRWEARAYCRWLQESFEASNPAWWQPGWEVRLPTEAEWEYAARGSTARGSTARGSTARRYPWGNQEPDPGRANFDDGKIGHPTPFANYPRGKTPEGLWDMAGNVLEWCLDGPREYEAGSVKDPCGPMKPDGGYVLRGGSWALRSGWLPASCRDGVGAGRRSRDVGFRCVVSGGLPA